MLTMNLFVCDNDGIIDDTRLAYPQHNFSAGPPERWLCTCCQGRAWHGEFVQQFYQRPNQWGHTKFVNRPPVSGDDELTVSME